MNTIELASSLRLAISILSKGLRKQIYEINTYSMTELDTLSYLFRNPKLLPTELAALTHITTQSMSQILNKMEKLGIIKKTPSKEDKRKVYISLTSTGKKIILKTRYERDEWLKSTIEKTLSEEEKDLLVKVLPVLNKLTEIK